jgi:hypothetical protein
MFSSILSAEKLEIYIKDIRNFSPNMEILTVFLYFIINVGKQYIVGQCY